MRTVRVSLTEWFSRRLRQIEEHYISERPGKRTLECVDRLRKATAEIDLAGLANNLLHDDKTSIPTGRRKLVGIDEGVLLE